MGVSLNVGILLLIVCLVTGCTSVLSETVMRESDPDISFTDLKKAPDSFVGKMVILGGSIIRMTQDETGSLLEVLQRPLDTNMAPLPGDRTGGRFLVRTPYRLTPELYKKAGSITLAGKVLGSETLPLDNTTYTYPVISLEDFYIWPEYGRDRSKYPGFTIGLGFYGTF